VEAVLEDYRSAPVSDAERALFAFIEKMNRESTAIDQRDVDMVRAAGWTDEALFNFYNKWIDATGVGDMPAAAYAASGERLATLGYARPAESPA